MAKNSLVTVGTLVFITILSLSTNGQSKSMMQVAQETPGFKASMVYENFGNGESVNTANGGLTVTHASSVSLPQNKGGNLGFTRVYNSKYRTLDEPTDTIEPSFGFLGPGWKLSFGRVFVQIRKFNVGTQEYFSPQWTYEDESGAEHRFYQVNTTQPSWIETMTWPIDAESDLPNQHKWYVTTDGSYLVAKFVQGTGSNFDGQILTSYWVIYFSDGSKRIVGGNANAFVMPIEGSNNYSKNMQTNGWYVTQIIDRTGINTINIHYYSNGTPDHPYAGSISQITDNFGRVVFFDLFSSGDGGSETQGDCLGSLNKVGLLKQIRYTYTDITTNSQKTIVEAYDYSLNPYKGDDCMAFMLTDVIDPEGLETKYEYIMPGGNISSYPFAGALLSKIYYPTGAISSYEHKLIAYRAHPCNYTPNCLDIVYITGLVVDSHTLTTVAPTSPNVTNISKWSWDRSKEPDFYIGLGNRTYPVITTDPYGVQEIHYFAFNNFNDAEDIQAGHERQVFRIKPGITITDTVIANPTNYSVFHTTNQWDMTIINGHALYCYDYIFDDNDSGELPVRITQANPRVKMLLEEERNLSISLWKKQTDYLWFDGFGHFLVNRNFNPNLTEITYLVNAIKYDLHKTLPSDAYENELDFQLDRQLLNITGIADSFAGATYFGEFKAVAHTYDENTGLMTDEVDYKTIQSYFSVGDSGILTTPSSSTGDRHISVSYDYCGNISDLAYSGGDADSQGGKQTYSVSFEWNHAMVSQMSWNNMDYAYPEFERQIEPGTSRIVSETDTNGFTTHFKYDDLGRLVLIAPHGEEMPSMIEYPLDEGSDWGTGHLIRFYRGGKEEIPELISGGTISSGSLADGDLFTSYEFDDLGRLWRTSTVMPEDNTWSVAEKAYDPVGNMIFQSYPYNPSDPTISRIAKNLPVPSIQGSYTIFPPQRSAGIETKDYGTWTTPFANATINLPCPSIADLDAFYRTKAVLDPEGGKTEITYNGLTKTVKVWRDSSNSSSTTYIKDIFGRLIKVDAPVGADATYSYDGLNNLTDANIGEQHRIYTYDGLGNVRTAQTPEAGTITFNSYDALGNLLSYTDANGNTVLNNYDAKGRILVTANNYINNVLRKWMYDAGESGTYGASYGKLIYSATRKDGNAADEWDFEEAYYYQGLNGRLSSKVSSISGTNYTVDYGYNMYGQLETESIPEMANYINFPITSAYGHGMLKSRTFSDGKGLTSASYNATGFLSSLAYSNGVSMALVENPAMTRLKSITVNKNGNVAPLWATGDYQYDRAGNITSIGTPVNEGYGVFSYDNLFRLLSASVNHYDPQAGEIRLYGFTYTYDNFGNMLKRNTTGNLTTYTGWVGETEARNFFSNAQFTAYVSTANNKISSVTRYNPESGSNELTAYETGYYDANGNLLNDGTFNLAYDALNQMYYSTTGTLNDIITESYVYDTAGERTSSLRRTVINSLLTSGTSSHFIRSGGKILAELVTSHNGTITTSKRYKAYLYAGDNLVTTAERETTITTRFAQSQNTTGICPQALAEFGFLSKLPTIGDPLFAPQNGQKYNASFILQDVSNKFAGAMVRIARLKDNGNSNDKDKGNGKRRSDEDKVQVYYFLQEGMDADFVFRKYGLESGQEYGPITQLVAGSNTTVSFDELQTDKKYRVTLTVWTSVGADPLLGYNMVDIEEGEFLVPKNMPNYHLHSKALDKNENGTGFKGVLRTTWADMSGLGAYSYKIMGKDLLDNDMVLNDEPIFGTEKDLSIESLEQKGYKKEAGFKVVAVDVGDNPLYSLGTVGAGIVLIPIRCRERELHLIVVPPAPTNLKGFVVNMDNVNNVALFWDGVLAVNDANHYRIPVGYEVYVTVNDGKQSTTAYLTTVQDLTYIDDSPPAKPFKGSVTYQVRAITMDFYHATSTYVDLVVDTSSTPINPATDLQVISLTGPTGQRIAKVDWTGVNLSTSTLKYYIYRAIIDDPGTDCANISQYNYYKIGEAATTTYTDDTIPEIYSNPLVAYKICVGESTVGCVTDLSDCAAVHCAYCADPPGAPSDIAGSSVYQNISLTWTAPVGIGVYEYFIYRGDIRFDEGIYLGKTNLTSYSTVYAGTSVQPFSIITVDLTTGCRSSAGVVDVALSSQCTAPPAIPSDVVLEESGDSFILSWTNVTGATQYRIYRAYGDEPLQYLESTSQINFSEYVAGGTYVKYGVSAVNSVACESDKAIKSAQKSTPPNSNEPTYYYYTSDHLNSVRLVIDSQGSIISRFDYEPYGVMLPRTTSADIEESSTRVRFTGQERDSFTSFDYMHARFYGSSIGRFMRPDPINGNPADPQSWNLYAYVRNNPVNATDPTGLTIMFTFEGEDASTNNPEFKENIQQLQDIENSTEKDGLPTEAAQAVKDFSKPENDVLIRPATDKERGEMDKKHYSLAFTTPDNVVGVNSRRSDGTPAAHILINVPKLNRVAPDMAHLTPLLGHELLHGGHWLADPLSYKKYSANGKEETRTQSGETNLRKALRRLNPELYKSIPSSHESWVYELQREEERNGAIW